MLKVNNIGKKFDNKVIFEDISFEIEANDRLLIIGPSGSGKTTLLRCLNKLETPESGEIYLDNDNYNNLDNNYIRKKVGMVFQSYNLFPHLTVHDNIALAPKLLKLDSKENIENNIRNILDSVHILDKIDEYPKNLSGGEKQRVAIARTLATNPEILLFDEPTSALDPEVIKSFIDVLKDLSKTKTIVVVSHEMDLIKAYATKVLFLADGKVLEYGEPSIIMNSSNEKVKKFLEQIN